MTSKSSGDVLYRVLLKTKALRTGVFKLSSGTLSPYFINMRITLSHPSAFSSLVGVYCHIVQSSDILESQEYICGIPTSGLPFASAVAYTLGKALVYVKAKGETHRGERMIEGVVKAGSSAILLDDVVGTGLTLASASEAVRRQGGIVTDAVALLDREEGGRAHLRSNGVELHVAAGITDIAQRLLEDGVIDDDMFKNVTAQTTSRKIDRNPRSDR